MKTLPPKEVDFLDRSIKAFDAFKKADFGHYFIEHRMVSTRGSDSLAMSHMSDLMRRLSGHGKLGLHSASRVPVIAKAQETFLAALDTLEKLELPPLEARKKYRRTAHEVALTQIDIVLPGVSRHGLNLEFEAKLIEAHAKNLKALEAYDPGLVSTKLQVLGRDLQGGTPAGDAIHGKIDALLEAHSNDPVEHLREGLSLAVMASRKFGSHAGLRDMGLRHAKRALENLEPTHDNLMKVHGTLSYYAKEDDNRPFRKFDGRSWGGYFRAAMKSVFKPGASADPVFLKEVYAMKKLVNDHVTGVRPIPKAQPAAPGVAVPA